MDHEEVGRHRDANSEAWTTLARAGYDTYRDGFNTPAFLEMLPDVEGLYGPDVGCGEGHNTRLVAGRRPPARRRLLRRGRSRGARADRGGPAGPAVRAPGRPRPGGGPVSTPLPD